MTACPTCGGFGCMGMECPTCEDTGTVADLLTATIKALIEQETKFAAKENAMNGKHAYAVKILEKLLEL